VLLLDEPTQGVDVGARAEIYTLVNQAVAQGCAVILVTSDFEELSHIAHRVIVLAGGRVTADVTGDAIEPAHLTQLAFAATTNGAVIDLDDRGPATDTLEDQP
jgi:ribose transport system ATP-binding protein